MDSLVTIGRGPTVPALKLKEISYLHAEGYTAGELKHGPIALLDKNFPVFAIATSGATTEKVVSNIQEVLARDAPVVALVGFFSFVANWTNYFLPYVLLPESDQFPVQVGLGTLLDDVPQFNPTVGSLAVQRPELALATLLAITPVLVVFLFSQRFLVTGMLAGATKE